MQSILSYPDRGPWGDASWRGNCSGYIYRDLFNLFKPKIFTDPMMGSGTSIEVAREMGIIGHGLDLYSGFDATFDSILLTVGEPSDLIVSHPPYHTMINYSKDVWGKEAHPRDLSCCSSPEEFHEKMQAVLLNQRDATKPDGYYGTIIGDLRRNGEYISSQAELIARMPASELRAVLIKQQHNCVSNSRNYAKLVMPRINHEFILIWQKIRVPVISLLRTLASAQQARLTGTWNSIVGLVLQRLGGKADLPAIYAEVSRSAPDRLQSNPHWKAKVRQTLQLSKKFTACERGVWLLA